MMRRMDDVLRLAPYLGRPLHHQPLWPHRASSDSGIWIVPRIRNPRNGPAPSIPDLCKCALCLCGEFHLWFKSQALGLSKNKRRNDQWVSL